MALHIPWESDKVAVRPGASPRTEVDMQTDIDVPNEVVPANDRSVFWILVSTIALCVAGAAAGVYGFDWFALFLEQFLRY